MPSLFSSSFRTWVIRYGAHGSLFWALTDVPSELLALLSVSISGNVIVLIWACVMYLSATICWSTYVQRALSAARLDRSGYVDGCWMMPARTASWATVSFDTGTPKYVCAAAATPLEFLPR